MNLKEVLQQSDPEIAKYVNCELNRQREKLELIASENIVSPTVLAAQGSVLTNKYAEGYPGKRYYGGCEFVDEVETLAIERRWPLNGRKNSLVPNMPMCSRIPVHRPTWRCSLPFCSPVIR